VSNSQWRDAALDQLKAFIAKNPKGEFLAHDVREFALGRGLPPAAHDAAWGAVMVKAKRDGLINKVGFGIRPSFGTTNSTCVSVWSAV
jgi:hypothetical protein